MSGRASFDRVVEVKQGGRVFLDIETTDPTRAFVHCLMSEEGVEGDTLLRIDPRRSDLLRIVAVSGTITLRFSSQEVAAARAVAWHEASRGRRGRFRLTREAAQMRTLLFGASEERSSLTSGGNEISAQIGPWSALVGGAPGVHDLGDLAIGTSGPGWLDAERPELVDAALGSRRRHEAVDRPARTAVLLHATSAEQARSLDRAIAEHMPAATIFRAGAPGVWPAAQGGDAAGREIFETHGEDGAIEAFCEFLYRGAFDSSDHVVCWSEPPIDRAWGAAREAVLTEQMLIEVIGGAATVSSVEALRADATTALLIERYRTAKPLGRKSAKMWRRGLARLGVTNPGARLDWQGGFTVEVGALALFRDFNVSAADFPRGRVSTDWGAAVRRLLVAAVEQYGRRVEERRPGRRPVAIGLSRDVLAADWRDIRPAGDLTDASVCLFVCFAPGKEVLPDACHYMRALRRAGYFVHCLIVDGSGELNVADPGVDVADAVSIRANEGYDFAIWAAAIRRNPTVWRARSLLLANDSMVGPLAACDEMWASVDRSSADVLGMVESREVRPHLQSFFLRFSRNALASPGLRGFWDKVRALPSKKSVIDVYELELTRRLRYDGLSIAALYDGVGSRNPTLTEWPAIVAAGLPFVKAQAYREHVARGEETAFFDRVAAAGAERAVAEVLFRARTPPTASSAAGSLAANPDPVDD